MDVHFEMSGFDELERKLNRMTESAEAMDGEHAVPLNDLFPPAFMDEYTDYRSLEELFEASGFTVETPQDFAAIPDAEWDAFIARVTGFSDWQAMQEKGAADWVARGIGLA